MRSTPMRDKKGSQPCSYRREKGDLYEIGLEVLALGSNPIHDSEASHGTK